MSEQAMVTDIDIARINELYKKSKILELTPEEKEEQAELRRRYIQSVRTNLKGMLNNISIKEPDGSITHLSKKHK